MPEKENVILLPKTIEYYQFQLTRMLETEQYESAVELLEFLLKCSGEDAAAYEEWEMLLAWLRTQLSDADLSEATEGELLDESMRLKFQRDHLYIEKLIDTIASDAPLDKKLLALEQLSFADPHPRMEQALKRWLNDDRLHPLMQFKVLQTLKRVGATGVIRMKRGDETAEAVIEDVPLEWEQFPEKLRRIVHIVQEKCEVHHPALSYFAQQLWEELLQNTYATNDYQTMLALSEEQLAAWAASLHFLSEKMMLGTASEDAVLSMYELNDEDMNQWHKAAQIMIKHVRFDLPFM